MAIYRERRLENVTQQITLSPKSGYTPANGDHVILSGSLEVNAASEGSPHVLGEVIVSDTGVLQNGKVTVATCYDKLLVLTADGAIQAGPVVLSGKDSVKQWLPTVSNGTQTVTIATNATGGGDITVTVDGIAVVVSPAASATPTTTAAAIVAAIKANSELVNKGFTAANSSGVVTITCIGENNDGASVAAASTDSTQTAVAGGATITGGSGYDVDSIAGQCIQSAVDAAEAYVLMNK